MSTHNIGFFEEISKSITYLSSNIIKYAPYFFCCSRGTVLPRWLEEALQRQKNFNMVTDCTGSSKVALPYQKGSEAV